MITCSIIIVVAIIIVVIIRNNTKPLRLAMVPPVPEVSLTQYTKSKFAPYAGRALPNGSEL